MDIQTIIEKKKEHREFLEVQITRLWNIPQNNPEGAKKLADEMYAELLTVAADILKLNNGIELNEVNEQAFARTASKYYRTKLVGEIEFETRCDIIHTANFWTRLFKKGK